MNNAKIHCSLLPYSFRKHCQPKDVLAMFKLTKRSVEAVEIRDSDYLVWDSSVKGFGVRVYPSGKLAYLVQYRVGKRTRRLTLGQHGPLTTEEARKLAKLKLGSVAHGGDPSAERQALRRAPTITFLCDRFIKEYAAEFCKPTTQRAYRAIIENHVKPRLGSFLILDVQRKDILDLHYKMRETPYQANRTVATLSKMFNVAEDWGLRPEGSNPVRRIKKYREEEKKRYLTDHEQSRLGQVLAGVMEDGSETVYVAAAFMLLLLTGCRRNEIQTLKWENVQATHLDLSDSKTGRRRIPLPREAYDILMSLPHQAGNPFVIVGATDAGHITDLERPWRRIRELASIQDVRIHDLRHTYASVAMKDGIDPFTLKEILGHKNLQTTLRYAHLEDDAVCRAAGAVASRLASAIHRRPEHNQRLQAVQ